MSDYRDPTPLVFTPPVDVPDQETCKHPDRPVFNGYVWKCRHCGKALETAGASEV